MLTIIFSKEGIPVSDFDLDIVATNIGNLAAQCEKNEEEIAFSSENIFYMLRLFVSNGKINRELIQFSYNGKTSKINAYGVFENKELDNEWPYMQISISENIIRNVQEIGRAIQLASKDSVVLN